VETDDQERAEDRSGSVEAGRDVVPRTLEGSMFAGRYRLSRLLSAGANTVIYDADDMTSQRPVTLKIVQPDLAVSPTFRERFDATIRGVAALSHPNIAAIFDWGEARFGVDQTMFVVIERLTAGSLRDMYDRGRRLSPSQALAVGLEACRGLDHAHRRGYVHGELTPSKLVFGDDRRLRIVDFGLAAMLGERQWEEPSSLSTHVARYASPEQALSLPIDGTTDVYALCLSLVEGVTGELPFASDSTVSTLAARVGRLMPVSADLGPLASVLERAGRPEAHERSTAAQFGRALVQAAEKLPRPEPLPLLSTGLFETPLERLREPEDPTGGVVRPGSDDLVIAVHDDDPNDHDDDLTDHDDDPIDDEPPARLETSDDLESTEHDDAAAEPSAVAAATWRELDEELGPGSGPTGGDDLVIVPVADDEPPPPPATTTTGVSDGAHTAGTSTGPSTGTSTGPHGTERLDLVVLDVEASPPERLIEASPRRRGGVAWVIVVPLLVLLLLGAMVFAAVRLFSTPSYEVPDLTGVEQTAALAEISDFEWDVQVDRERSDVEPRADHVIRTVPTEGERLARGEPFLLVVSDGPVLRELPELGGLSVVEAVLTLEALDLVAVIEETFDEDVPPDRVVEWSVTDEPDLVAGDGVEPGTEVVVTGSLGPEPRVVPDFEGADRGDVMTALADLGLVLAADEAFDDEAPAGDVISQDPAAGEEVARDSVVSVTFSLGPDLVEFPDLTDLTFPEAQEAAAESGLELVLVFGASDGEFVSATVDGDAVSPGDQLRRGTQVDVTFL
jgi:eukaryotic-like serine/threonine-protein kinase